MTCSSTQQYTAVHYPDCSFPAADQWPCHDRDVCVANIPPQSVESVLTFWVHAAEPQLFCAAAAAGYICGPDAAGSARKEKEERAARREQLLKERQEAAEAAEQRRRQGDLEYQQRGGAQGGRETEISHLGRVLVAESGTGMSGSGMSGTGMSGTGRVGGRRAGSVRGGYRSLPQGDHHYRRDEAAPDRYQPEDDLDMEAARRDSEGRQRQYNGHEDDRHRKEQRPEQHRRPEGTAAAAAAGRAGAAAAKRRPASGGRSAPAAVAPAAAVALAHRHRHHHQAAVVAVAAAAAAVALMTLLTVAGSGSTTNAAGNRTNLPQLAMRKRDRSWRRSHRRRGGSSNCLTQLHGLEEARHAPEADDDGRSGHDRSGHDRSGHDRSGHDRSGDGREGAATDPRAGSRELSRDLDRPAEKKRSRALLLRTLTGLAVMSDSSGSKATARSRRGAAAKNVMTVGTVLPMTGGSMWLGIGEELMVVLLQIVLSGATTGRTGIVSSTMAGPGHLGGPTAGRSWTGMLAEGQGMSVGTAAGQVTDIMTGGTVTDMIGGKLADMTGGTTTDLTGGMMTDMTGRTMMVTTGGTVAGMRGRTMRDMAGGTMTVMTGGIMTGMTCGAGTTGLVKVLAGTSEQAGLRSQGAGAGPAAGASALAVPAAAAGAGAGAAAAVAGHLAALVPAAAAAVALTARTAAEGVGPTAEIWTASTKGARGRVLMLACQKHMHNGMQ